MLHEVIVCFKTLLGRKRCVGEVHIEVPNPKVRDYIDRAKVFMILIVTGVCES